MRKLLLGAVAAMICGTGMSQHAPLKSHLIPVKAIEKNVNDNSLNNTGSVVNQRIVPNAPEGVTSVEITTIGDAANAYGLYNGGRTYLWVDQNINSISFVHRMGANPGSGFLAYDLSTDGGVNWDVNRQVYAPGDNTNARYPQGAIYNPAANTDPNNAYFTYFAPTLDGSNAGTWGGYGAGAHKLDNSTAATQQNFTTTGDFYKNVPTTMVINPVTGELWVVETALNGGLSTDYDGKLIVTRGIWNDANGDYDYTESLFEAPMLPSGENATLSDVAMAFAPDGQIGYISCLGDNGSDDFSTGFGYIPVLYKTEDGGNTWSEPINVPLSGPEGLTGILNYLSDEQLASAFDPVPARDEILYTLAFTHKIAVDYAGNPHICVTVGLGSTDTPYSIVASGGNGATFDIHSSNQGVHWQADMLAPNKTFRGEFGEISEDNRSQISTTPNGKKMFFTWLDTHYEEEENNVLPDIFCVGLDVMSNKYTEPKNVTYLTEGWLGAFQGTAPNYVFDNGDNCMIPFVYQDMNANDPAAAVTFKYIHNFVISDADYTITGVNEEVANLDLQVSDVYPNPAENSAAIDLNLEDGAQVSVSVFNLMGQEVMNIAAQQMKAGVNMINLNVNGLSNGLYFTQININNQTVSRKLVVE